jgi:uncharacterized protein
MKIPKRERKLDHLKRVLMFPAALLLCLTFITVASAGELEDKLIGAAEIGDTAAVHALLDKGADLNTRDVFGLTALMRGALNGHTEVVRYLLAKGANVNATNFVGTTALMHAAGSGYIDIVRALIEKHADLTMQNALGMTALDIAAQNKYDDTVRVLKEAGQTK